MTASSNAFSALPLPAPPPGGAPACSLGDALVPRRAPISAAARTSGGAAGAAPTAARVGRRGRIAVAAAGFALPLLLAGPALAASGDQPEVGSARAAWPVPAAQAGAAEAAPDGLGPLPGPDAGAEAVAEAVAVDEPPLLAAPIEEPAGAAEAEPAEESAPVPEAVAPPSAEPLPAPAPAPAPAPSAAPSGAPSPPPAPVELPSAPGARPLSGPAQHQDGRSPAPAPVPRPAPLAQPAKPVQSVRPAQLPMSKDVGPAWESPLWENAAWSAALWDRSAWQLPVREGTDRESTARESVVRDDPVRDGVVREGPVLVRRHRAALAPERPATGGRLDLGAPARAPRGPAGSAPDAEPGLDAAGPATQDQAGPDQLAAVPSPVAIPTHWRDASTLQLPLGAGLALIGCGVGLIGLRMRRG
ncbi:hypothetical protein [Kitasatospora sp. NPDC050543]|uniref:hypothetical protein n=1 Tax=Kitasatospora sp. NPDC050543 TaxID=3364054 RepID=UPI0037BC0940